MLWLDENHRAFGEASTPWKKKSGLDISLYCSGIQHYENEGVVSVKSEAIGHWLEINKGFIPSISILAIMFSAWPTKTEIGEAMKVCCKLVFQQPARRYCTHDVFLQPVSKCWLKDLTQISSAVRQSSHTVLRRFV